MTKVAVIGAAGYVGLRLVRELKLAGHEVAGIARANGRMLLEREGVEVFEPGELDRVEPVGAVVNLAYPTSGSVFEYPKRNREILRSITRLAVPGTPVIHVSTLAVFGFDLEFPQVLGPVKSRREFTYIESKIELEMLLNKMLRDRPLHIVRLGNVWGPASPTWTHAIADKMLFGDAVGVRNEDGFCNATDVANVTSYLAFLVKSGSEGESRYHHLAELGELRWSHWVGLLAGRLAVKPTYASYRPPQVSALKAELAQALKAHGPLAVAKELVRGRFTGSVLRSVVRLLPERTLGMLRLRRRSRIPAESLEAIGDPVFLGLMSCPRRFISQVDSRWTPKVDAKASWGEVANWLDRAGY